jgi:hypothetical protein
LISDRSFGLNPEGPLGSQVEILGWTPGRVLIGCKVRILDGILD